MSDGGGDSGGSSKGGGGSSKGGDSGGSDPVGATPTGQGVNAPTTAETITAGPSANIPILGSSFSADGGTAVTPSAPSSVAAPGPSTATLGAPSGVADPTAVPGASAAPIGVSTPTAGVGAASLAAPGAVSGAPTDLTSELGIKGSADPLGAPTGTALTADQLGAAPSGASGSTGSAGTAAAAKPAEQTALQKLGITSPLGTGIGLAGLGYAMSQKPSTNPSGVSGLDPGTLASIQNYMKSAQQTAQGQGGLAGTATTAGETSQAQSGQLYQQGQNLVQYLQTGQLPPEAQASLDQATASAKATIKSRYSAQGMNADPAQNSTLAAELAQIDQQAMISKGQLEQQYQTSGTELINASNQFASQAAADNQAAAGITQNMAQSGMAAAGLSSDLYKTLVGIDQTQQAAIGNAISNFSKAISAGSGGTTIKVG